MLKRWHRYVTTVLLGKWYSMMTSSNGIIFRVTGPLCGEFTGHWWIPQQKKTVTRSIDAFFDMRLNKRLGKQSRSWWYETRSRSLWRHCSGFQNMDPHVWNCSTFPLLMDDIYRCCSSVIIHVFQARFASRESIICKSLAYVTYHGLYKMWTYMVLIQK